VKVRRLRREEKANRARGRVSFRRRREEKDGIEAHLRHLVSTDDNDHSRRIQSSSTSSTRHLSVLSRKEISESVTVVLSSPREDDRPSRHVDSLENVREASISMGCSSAGNKRAGGGRGAHHSEGLGREKNLDVSLSEKDLDDLDRRRTRETKSAIWNHIFRRRDDRLTSGKKERRTRGRVSSVVARGKRLRFESNSPFTIGNNPP